MPRKPLGTAHRLRPGIVLASPGEYSAPSTQWDEPRDHPHQTNIRQSGNPNLNTEPPRQQVRRLTPVGAVLPGSPIEHGHVDVSMPPTIAVRGLLVHLGRWISATFFVSRSGRGNSGNETFAALEPRLLFEFLHREDRLPGVSAPAPPGEPWCHLRNRSSGQGAVDVGVSSPVVKTRSLLKSAARGGRAGRRRAESRRARAPPRPGGG